MDNEIQGNKVVEAQNDSPILDVDLQMEENGQDVPEQKLVTPANKESKIQILEQQTNFKETDDEFFQTEKPIKEKSD